MKKTKRKFQVIFDDGKDTVIFLLKAKTFHSAEEKASSVISRIYGENNYFFLLNEVIRD